MNLGLGIHIGGKGGGAGVPLQSEYLTVKAAMTTPPSDADVVIQNKWVYDLKQAGVWVKAILLDNFACPDSQAGLLNWKSPGTFNPSLVNAPPYTTYKGFTTTRVGGKIVRTNFVPSTDGAGFLGQDDMTFIIAINSNINEGYYDFGSTGADSTDTRFMSRTASYGYVSLNGLPTKSLTSVNSIRYWSCSRTSATEIELYKNYIKKVIASTSVGLSTTELFAGGISVSTMGNKLFSFCLVFKYLTEAEIQLVIKACDAYLKNYNTHLFSFQTTIEFNLVLEGHSAISAGTYMEDAIFLSHNIIKAYTAAVSGNTMTDLVARAATVDGKLIVETAIYKNILPIWVGVNDVDAEGEGTTIYNALKSYVQARVAAGWKAFVFTMTPTSAGGRGAIFETERGIFNGLLRNDLSLLSNVYVLDTDTVPALCDYTDTTYFKVDQLHLTEAGALLANQLLTAVMVTLYG